MTGTLYLIPTIIAEDTHERVIPPQVKETLKEIHHFLAEDLRTARRYLSSLKIYPSIEALNFEILNKETPEGNIPEFLKPLREGFNVGVISESGCPGVADPGALAVAYAQANNFKVVPLVGPSSILLALMASGLNGQQFAFHGYLPIEAANAAEKIKELEKESKEKNQTQLFIETPYRNNKLLAHLLKHLRPETLLCVAANLTAKDEFIRCRSVREWKNEVPVLEKLPVTFLFLADGK